MTEELPLLIDSTQACKMLFGSDQDPRNMKYRLYAMIERGEIAATKLGTRYFIPRAEMEKFINANA
jgi:excisionase family DNA binding protein